MTFTAVRRLITSHRCAWLLIFALWLPGAQLAAATHALVHLYATDIGDPDLADQAPSTCELCVVASAVSGGGAASHPPALIGLEPAALAVFFLTHAAPVSRPALAYRSRAPPLPHV